MVCTHSWLALPREGRASLRGSTQLRPRGPLQKHSSCEAPLGLDRTLWGSQLSLGMGSWLSALEAGQSLLLHLLHAFRMCQLVYTLLCAHTC